MFTILFNHATLKLFCLLPPLDFVYQRARTLFTFAPGTIPGKEQDLIPYWLIEICQGFLFIIYYTWLSVPIM